MGRPLPKTAAKNCLTCRSDRLGADGAKRSFLAAMSHELRTPLNAIIGFAEIMDAQLFGPSPEPYRAYVHDILLSARRVLQIIEDVLEISRAEAGELVLNKREVHLDALVTAAIQDVRRFCPEREHELVIDVAPDLVAQLDPEKFQRIVASLLSNAVKFSPVGSIIRVTACLEADRTLTISVADQGIGMRAAEIQDAFAPFAQLDGSLSRRFDGAGLGLPLARLLAELHGGLVELDSRPGKGTTARVTLPVYGRSGLSSAAGLWT